MSIFSHEVKTVKRYPLIELWSFKKDGNTITRQVRYNNKYKDKRWYHKYLNLLYAKQVAKLYNYYWVVRGKGIMEFPYSICDVFNTDEIESVYCKYAININTKEGYGKKKGFKSGKSSISGEEILESELEN